MSAPGPTFRRISDSRPPRRCRHRRRLSAPIGWASPKSVDTGQLLALVIAARQTLDARVPVSGVRPTAPQRTDAQSRARLSAPDRSEGDSLVCTITDLQGIKDSHGLINPVIHQRNSLLASI